MKVLQTTLAVLALGFVAVVITLLLLKGSIGPKDAVFPSLVGETAITQANSKRRHPDQFRGMVWNVHYGHGSETDHFARHSAVEVDGTLEGIAKTIKEADVDFVLLQEVDLDADRSHNEDQLRLLATRAGFPYYAFVSTWRARYIPFPYAKPSSWLGKVHSGQGVLSRFPITANRRVLLPQPPEQPFWYNWFYLNRAIQIVELAVPDEAPIQLFNIHLEAFSNSNRMEQARLLKDVVWNDARPDDRFLVAGDFNATAPEAPQKKAFVDEPETDFSADQTISLVRTGMPTVDLLMRFKVKKRIFTFPADAPNRQLDHVFAGRGWSRSYAWVQDGGTGVLSDHLPLRLVLTGAPSIRAGQRQKTRVKQAVTPANETPEEAKPSELKSNDGNTIFRGDTGPEGLGVEIRDPGRLDVPTPIQGKPPKPPSKLNPDGWLEGAEKLDKKP